MDDANVEEDVLDRFAEIVGHTRRDIAGWIPVLRRLAEIEDLRTLALGGSAEITCASVRSIIETRRLRDTYFWPSMSEAAWALLLELFASGLEGERLDMAGLGAATGLPPDTTLHWIDWLAGRGMVLHKPEADNGEAARVDLTDRGSDQMRAYLLAALKLSPWVP